MRAVMYHYVREYDEQLPNFRFLDIENFQKQLDHFERDYGFVTPLEWEGFIRAGVMPEKNGKVVLTFDDAFTDHYDYVFRELRVRGLWGLFYVPTQPYTHGRMLDVHRIHLLCGAHEGHALYARAQEIVTEAMIPDAKREEFRKETYTKQQDNYEGVSEFKRLMNYFIHYAYRSEVLDEMVSAFPVDCAPSHYYLSEKQIAEMNEAGMVIGSHTASHPVMSKLDLAMQEKEIAESFDFLYSVCTPFYKTYCHPYGGSRSYNTDTIRALNDQKVDFSFSVESRPITSEDKSASYQYLPRFDCNEFPFGKAS